MIYTKSISLDLAHPYINEVIRLHEGDVNGSRLQLAVYDNGSAFTLSGYTVKYDAVIAGCLAENDAAATVSSGNIINIPITTNMTALSGILQIDVKIIDTSSSANQIFFFQTIEAFVQRRIIDGETIIDISGTTIWQVLDELENKFPIGTDDIANGAVTSAKLGSSAVTSAKIANVAVSSGKIASNAVTSDKIASGAVTADKIASGVIPTKTSDLTNDSGFLTAHQDISGKMDLMPSVPFDDENDCPDMETSQFNILKLGQVFQSSAFPASAPRYWVKYRTQAGSFAFSSAELITQIPDISGKMDLVVTVQTDDTTNIPLGQVFKYQNQYYIKSSMATPVGAQLHIADADNVPTKTSDLTNDSGFLTQHQDISGKANISDIPTKTSDLTNDSGFLTAHQDISGKMDINASVPFDDENDRPDTDTSQFNILLPGQIFQSSQYPTYSPRYWVKYRTQVGSFTFDAAELLTTHQDISGKEDKSSKVTAISSSSTNTQYPSAKCVYDGLAAKATKESGTISSNHAWYTDESQGYTMTGTYTVIGDMCYIRATAYLIEGWERVYYSLPVAATASSATIALHGEDTFTIATGTQNNISVLEIKQLGSQYMGSGTIKFTLAYKCQ